MRKNFKKRINVDQRKYITTGYPSKEINPKTGRPNPKKTNHFVFFNPDTGEEYYPELREFYGDECKEIFIMFPSNNYEDFFSDDYNKWTLTHNLKRRCDGETCLHSMDDVVEVDGKKIKYNAGTETECICRVHGFREFRDDGYSRIIDREQACGCDLFLKAFILNPNNSRVISPSCYLFYSGSDNNADNVRSQLETFKRFLGIPFKISLKEVKRDKQVYYLWNIIPHLTPEQLIEYQYTKTALTDGQNLLLSESVHTEQKESYNENTGSPDCPPKNQTTHCQNSGEPVLNDNELNFTDKKQWSIREFEEKFSTGEIEGEDNIRQIADNILSSSPTLEDFEAKGMLLLKVPALTESTKDIITTVAKAVRHRKGWDKKK